MANNENELSPSSSTLDEHRRDKCISYFKAASGAVPFGIGSVLAEFVTSFIPDQRQDRVIKFLKLVDDRLTDLEKSQFGLNHYAGDLLEESMVSASRALSEERNKFLANITVSCTDCDEELYNFKRQVLYALSELTDLEIHFLHLVTAKSYKAAYREFSCKAVTEGEYRRLSEAQRREYDLGKVRVPMIARKLQRLDLIEEMHDPNFLNHDINDLSQLREIIWEDKTNIDKHFKETPFGLLMLQEIGLL